MEWHPFSEDIFVTGGYDNNLNFWMVNEGNIFEVK